MKIIDEFKAFAMRGNVIDLAVGVVIGGAFGKIVSSLVADIITPAVGILVGGINFTELGYTIRNIKGVEVTITYGNFLQTTFDFIIIAFSIFLVVKVINKTQEKINKKQKAEEKKVEIKKAADIILLEEIRDLLKGDKKEKVKKIAEIKKEVVPSTIELKTNTKKLETKLVPDKEIEQKSKKQETKIIGDKKTASKGKKSSKSSKKK